jgi:hypothetical protein
MPTLRQRIDALGLAADRKTQVVASFGNSLYSLDAEMNDERWAEQLALRYGLQSAAKPNLIFIGFQSQARVDQIVAAMDIVGELLRAGLAQVGQWHWHSSSHYETYFGKKVRTGRNVSWPRRELKVRNTVQAMIDNLAARAWVFWDHAPGVGDDVATHSGGWVIKLGGAWPAVATREVVGGVLVHEMGHAAGLLDICEASGCVAKLGATGHYVDLDGETVRCRQPTHAGWDKIAGHKGHYTGGKRSRRLAADHKNLAVWNADNYRWFCLAAAGAMPPPAP